MINSGQGVNPFLAIIIKIWVKGNLHYIGICQTLQQCFIIQKIIITKQIQNKQDWESIQDCEYVFFKIEIRLFQYHVCQDHVMFIKTLMSRPCLVCQDHFNLSWPCHICQEYVIFFKTMSRISTTSSLVKFGQVWSSLIKFDQMFCQHVSIFLHFEQNFHKPWSQRQQQQR
jgi:hypothetical protein